MPQLSDLPYILFVGGKEEDRTSIAKRCLEAGLRVKEHWMSREGGHDYSRLPTGVKLVVVWRDLLDINQYNKACTLADVGRVPKVKYDVDRERFYGRLSDCGMLGQPPEPEKLPEPPKFNEAPTIEEKPVETPVVLPLPTLKPVDFSGAGNYLQPLLHLAELIRDEIATNPHYRGLTVMATDSDSFEVTPIPRTFKLGMVGETRIDIKPTYRSATAESEPKVEEPSKPSEPPQRPVYQPIVPRIEKPRKKGAATTEEPRDNLGRRIGRRIMMDMQCRYPGCNAKSRGPRFKFHCSAHSSIPKKQQEENCRVYKSAKQPKTGRAR